MGFCCVIVYKVSSIRLLIYQKYSLTTYMYMYRMHHDTIACSYSSTFTGMSAVKILELIDLLVLPISSVLQQARCVVSEISKSASGLLETELKIDLGWWHGGERHGRTYELAPSLRVHR